MAAEAQRTSVASLLPAALVAQVRSSGAVGEALWQCSGVALCMDISGFSRFAERLSHEGALGAERLADELSAIFGPIVADVTGFGGSVEQFAGDNLLAAWSGDTEQALARAQQCAASILQRFAHAKKNAERPSLSVRIGIGVGELSRACLPGAQDRFIYVVGGSAVERAQRAEVEAAEGSVLVDAHSAATAEPAAEHLESAPISLSEPSKESLLPFLAPALRRLIDTDAAWLPEFRNVQILFADLGRLGFSAVDEQSFARLLRKIDSLVEHAGGALLQVVAEKGSHIALAVWGISGATHEDEPVRALQTALAMSAALQEQGLAGQVGVSRGRVFFGLRGGAARSEHAVIGTRVNLAARIMQRCGSGVVCDEVTRQLSGSHLAFSQRDLGSIKGFDETPKFYSVTERLDAVPVTAQGMLERSGELDLITDHISRASTGHGRSSPSLSGTAFVLEGEAGIGKSKLIDELVARAQALGAQCLVGLGSSINRNAAYHPWRRIIAQLAGVTRATSAADQVERYRALLAAIEAESQLALLADVLPIDAAAAPVIALEGRARVSATTLLLVDLLRQAATQAPLVLIMEDAHWCDSASWSVAQRVLQADLPITLVVAQRPEGTVFSEPAQYVRSRGLVLSLAPLSEAAVEQLLLRTIAASSVSEPVLRWFAEKTQGHPFFVEELAKGLRESGQLEVRDGVCAFASRFFDDGELALRDSIDKVVMTRVDALRPELRRVLAVASVIGRDFPLDLLCGVGLTGNDLADLQRCLDELTGKGLIEPGRDASEESFRFHHDLIRDGIYESMTFSQRAETHCAIAEYLAEASTKDPDHALLAHHWLAADRPERGARHASAAGEHALRTGAHSEALGFYAKLLDLHNNLAALPEDLSSSAKVAEWEYGCGECHYSLGDFHTARQHFQEALALLGAPTPQTRLQWVRVILRNILRQMRYRISYPAETKPALRYAALSAERMSEHAYFQRNQVGMVGSSLLSANLSTQAGAPGPLSRAYSMLSVMLCVGGLRRPSEFYHQAAIDLALREDDIGAQIFASYTRAVALTGNGHFERATELATRALGLAEQTGNQEELEMSLCALGNPKFYGGQIDESEQVFVREVAVAARRANHLHEAWGLYAIARARIARGDYAAAEGPIVEAKKHLAETNEAVSLVVCHGLMAEVLVASNRYDAALKEAGLGLELLRSGPPTVQTELEGYAGIATALLSTWERSLRLARPISEKLKTDAAYAVKAMGRFANTFPIGAPRFNLLQGRLHWLLGQEKRAVAVWRRGIDLAQQIEMPLELGLAHRELGQRLQGAQAQEHKNQANQLMASIGCRVEGGTPLPLATTVSHNGGGAQ